MAEQSFQNVQRIPVMEGSVALFPRTLRCLLDFNSPPSTTSHRTESVVLDLTNKDIIPPAIKKNMNLELQN